MSMSESFSESTIPRRRERLTARLVSYSSFYRTMNRIASYTRLLPRTFSQSIVDASSSLSFLLLSFPHVEKILLDSRRSDTDNRNDND